MDASAKQRIRKLTRPCQRSRCSSPARVKIKVVYRLGDTGITRGCGIPVESDVYMRMGHQRYWGAKVNYKLKLMESWVWVVRYFHITLKWCPVKTALCQNATLSMDQNGPWSKWPQCRKPKRPFIKTALSQESKRPSFIASFK